MHRDTDKRERAIECNVEWIACELLVDLIEVVHRLVMIRRPGRIQDVPSCVDVQLSLYTEDTNQSPERNRKKTINFVSKLFKKSSLSLTYIADGAVISRLNVVLAVVASVHELVLPLIVKLVQHAQRRELSASK